MDRFFDNNNPLMRFLSRIVDLAILNLMTVLALIPVITAGPALTAMNNVLIHLVRRDETYVWRMFRASLKLNLRQGMGMGLLYLAVFAFIGADLLVLRTIDSRLSTLLMIMITVIGICVFVIGIYSFALQARFENTVRATLWNAAALALGHIPRSLAMVGIWAAWAVLLWYIHGIALLVFLIYGLSLPTGACTLLYDPIFREMEPEDPDAE